MRAIRSAVILLLALGAMACDDTGTRRPGGTTGTTDAGQDAGADGGGCAGPFPTHQAFCECVGFAAESCLDGGGFDSGLGGDSGPGDAGPQDSGPVDSGPVDSGPVDSGPVDSGPIDSGPVDSGPADSGPVDSGPTDAGPLACNETLTAGPTKVLDQWPLDAAWLGSAWAAVVDEEADCGGFGVCGFVVTPVKVSSSVFPLGGPAANAPVELDCHCARLGAKVQQAAVVPSGTGGAAVVLVRPRYLFGSDVRAIPVFANGQLGTSLQLRTSEADYVTGARGDNNKYVACWNEDALTDSSHRGDEIVCRPFEGLTSFSAPTAARVAITHGGASFDLGTVRPALAYGPFNEFGLVYGRSIRLNDGSTDVDLYFTILDSAAQEVVSRAAIVAGPAHVGRQHLAWNGTVYGLAYRSFDAGAFSLKFARLSSTGSVVGTPLTVATASNTVLPRVAWVSQGGRQEWTITWVDGVGLYVARVSAAGALLSSSMVGLTLSGSYNRAMTAGIPTGLLWGSDGTYVGTVGCQ